MIRLWRCPSARRNLPAGTQSLGHGRAGRSRPGAARPAGVRLEGLAEPWHCQATYTRLTTFTPWGGATAAPAGEARRGDDGDHFAILTTTTSYTYILTILSPVHAGPSTRCSANLVSPSPLGTTTAGATSLRGNAPEAWPR